MSRQKKTESTEKKERASIGRERKLALALRAVLDAHASLSESEGVQADTDADTLLTELGYGTLEGIPKRVARLEAELATALESKNYTRVSELGKELERAREGKSSAPPVTD